MSILQAVMVTIVASLISGLATFTFTMIWSRSTLKEKAKDAITTHEKIHHQDSIYKYVKQELDDHKTQCRANNVIDKIEKGVYFLLIKNGASQEELNRMGF